MARSTSRTIERKRQLPTPQEARPPERDPGQEFIDWVLGYGYAAGHWIEPEPQKVRDDEARPRAK